MSAGSKRIGLGILVWGILVSPLGSALASSAACVNCHQDQVSAWSDSDHAWAMRPPEAAFIKAPFQGESVAFDGLEGLFDQSDRAPADVALPAANGPRFKQWRGANPVSHSLAGHQGRGD